MAAALITERSPGCFGFAHGVVRETLTEGMSALRRSLRAPAVSRPIGRATGR